MKTYLVGGAVRDRLLELPVGERDWVVVGATPQDLLDNGYTPVGKDFPVFLHPETKEEYALARTERKSGHGYTGFEIHADPDVSLEDDLLRRDLTINAIAEDTDGTLIDPYGGEEDLANGLLKHVSPAFAEDPVRILRIARFAARFAQYGFKVAHSTNALMRTMVENGEVDYLVPERVWHELEKALQTQTPARFFSVLKGCHALAVLFPQLEYCYSESTGHGHDADDLPVLTAATQLSASPVVRFAALACDMQVNRASLDELCSRYRTPNPYRQLARLAVDYRERVHSFESLPAEEKITLLESIDAFRRSERIDDFLIVCEADAGVTRPGSGGYPQATQLRTALAAAKNASVDTTGKKGPEIGAALRAARIATLEQIL